MRNRTNAAQNSKAECEGLAEIDEYATRARHKAFDDDERLLLDVARTGLTWQKEASFYAGKADDNLCLHCGAANETAAHLIGACCALDQQRKAADVDLATCDAEQTLPAPILHGIAPALAGDFRKTYRGGSAGDTGTAKLKSLECVTAN